MKTSIAKKVVPFMICTAMAMSASLPISAQENTSNNNLSATGSTLVLRTQYDRNIRNIGVSANSTIQLNSPRSDGTWKTTASWDGWYYQSFNITWSGAGSSADFIVESYDDDDDFYSSVGCSGDSGSEKLSIPVGSKVVLKITNESSSSLAIPLMNVESTDAKQAH